MTIDQQLERLLSVVSTLADVSQRNTRDITDLKTSVQGLVNVAQIHQQSLEVVVTEIREMQAEVKGLQTENRRILDQLINRNGNQD
jgi:hypothetical protein